MTESNTSNEAERSSSKAKLFVGGLANIPNVTEEVLEEYFTKWGKVCSFQLIKDNHTQKVKGFGFVTFECVDAASNCLNHSLHTFDGKNISVKPCKEKERHDRSNHYQHHYNGRHHQNHNFRPSISNYMVHHPQHMGNHYGPRPGMNYWSLHNGHRYPNHHPNHHPNHADHLDNHSTKSSSSVQGGGHVGGHLGPGGHVGGHPRHGGSGLHPKDRNGSGDNAGFGHMGGNGNGGQQRNDDECQVFVGGLPHNAGEKDLSAHFSRFGLVENVSVAKDKQGGEGHKGFAFVTFTTKEDRDKSLDHNDHRIKNRTVKVEKKKPSGKREQSRPNYQSSLKNPNGSFNHPRHGIVPKEKPPNGRQAQIEAHQISQNREQNGIISPELNKVGPYQQPIPSGMNPSHLVSTGQYMMPHPMHNYHPQHAPNMYQHQQHVMYPAQPIFHPIQQVMNPGHNMIAQDPNQLAYHSYVMPQVVQQPLMMQHPGQLQQGQVQNSQPPIRLLRMALYGNHSYNNYLQDDSKLKSQSPHPGQGGYFINATQSQIIQMTQNAAVLPNNDTANQQQLHGTPGRSPTIQ